MTDVKRTLVSLTLIISALSVSAPASIGAVLFQDNFESQPAGNVNHTTYSAFDVNALPTAASPGNWTTAGTTARNMAVTADASYPNLVPFAGQNFLRMFTDTGGVVPVATANFAGANQVGDLVQVRAEVWSEGTQDFNVEIYGSGTHGLLFDTWTGVGGTIQTITGGATSVPYAAGSWQQWEVDYVIGAPTFTISVNGISATAAVVGAGDLTSVSFSDGKGGFFLSGFDNISVSVASVPEPSSIVLCASAMLGLLACVWRKRSK